MSYGITYSANGLKWTNYTEDNRQKVTDREEFRALIYIQGNSIQGIDLVIYILVTPILDHVIIHLGGYSCGICVFCVCLATRLAKSVYFGNGPHQLIN